MTASPKTETHVFDIAVRQLIHGDALVQLFSALDENMDLSGIQHLATLAEYEAIGAHTDENGINYITFKATYVPST